LPLLAVALFVMGEVLGLTPRFLQGSPWITFGTPPKYVLLIVVLGSVAIFEAIDKRNTGRRAQGFSMRPGGTTPPAVAGGNA
jgi:hypothetical protein